MSDDQHPIELDPDAAAATADVTDLASVGPTEDDKSRHPAMQGEAVRSRPGQASQAIGPTNLLRNTPQGWRQGWARREEQLVEFAEERQRRIEVEANEAGPGQASQAIGPSNLLRNTPQGWRQGWARREEQLVEFVEERQRRIAAEAETNDNDE